ncbi:MAG: RcpC/CpaB family pilus assembly protein [Planctomycetaceae bacterium]
MHDAHSRSFSMFTSVVLWLICQPALAEEPIADPSLPEIHGSHVIEIKVGTKQSPIEIKEDQEVTLRFDKRIRTVEGFDTGLLHVRALAPNEIKLETHYHIGETTLTIITEDGSETAFAVTVADENPRLLLSYLERLFPNAKLELHQIKESILIRGTVISQEELEQVTDVAKEFYPNVLMYATVEGALPQSASIQIPKGMRVVSVKAKDTQTHGNLLAPGDRVDVVVTYRKRDKYLIRTQVRPLLEYVTIFATRDSDNGDTFKNVSLLVTPEQAAYIQLAERKGELSLVWRNNADDEQVQIGAIDERLIEELQGTNDDSLTTLPNSDQPPKFVDEPGTVAEEGDLQTEIRALHADVKRLIELLEKRQPAGDAVVPQQDQPDVVAAEPLEQTDLKVMYFHAKWVTPSQELRETIDRIAAEETIEVTKIDVDKEDDLVEKYGIHTLPCLLVVYGHNQSFTRLQGNRLNEKMVRRTLRQAKHPSYYVVWQSTGLLLEPVPADGIDSADGIQHTGLRIEDDSHPTSLARAELQVGDIITGLGTRQASSISVVQQALLSDLFHTNSKGKPVSWVSYHALRNGRPLTGYLQLDQSSLDILHKPILSPPTQDF